jgi:hypothetical protein
MALFRPGLIIIILLSCLPGITQNKNADKELWGKADKLNIKAAKLWENGDRVEAEKMFKEANDLYYVSNGFSKLAQLKISNDEINDGNTYFKKAIASAKTYQNILVYLPYEGLGSGHSYMTANEIIQGLYLQQAKINLRGDINVTIAAYDAFLKNGGDEGYLVAAAEAAFLADDRSAFSNFYERLKKASGQANWNKKLMGLIDAFADILQEKYSDGVDKLVTLEKEGGFRGEKTSIRLYLALAHSLNKQPNESEAVLKKITNNAFIGNGFAFLGYIRGLNELSKNNPDAAVKFLSDDLKTRKGTGHVSYALFRQYAARAEAYMLKRNFIAAKADFETALLFNANYTPAQNGLAKLEGKIITERKTDKIPPVIVLTEPVATRGLKVTTSGFDVMFRGTASDQSGLKSVMINNTNVYVQENGNFWGTVTLKEGINTVLIEATDVAGNTGKIEVQVEKNIAEKKDDIVPVVDKEAKNYALIIASQTYDDPSIPSLENPVSDAVKLKLALKNNYNFSDDNIFTVYNPTVIDLKKKFAELTEIIQPEDNIIIFYAGHGIWVEKEKKGYWLLTEAKRNDVNTWFPNKLMLDLISKLPSRHTLLITDACFSGSVFKTRSLGNDAPPAMREMSEKISRVAITSGNDTEVPDESVFMKYLVKALSENKEKYLTAQKMFITQIIEAVMTETKTEPRYGTLELAGHVGGDFIFVKK